jgi:hypothetical protein
MWLSWSQRRVKLGSLEIGGVFVSKPEKDDWNFCSMLTSFFAGGRKERGLVFIEDRESVCLRCKETFGGTRCLEGRP